MSLTIELEGEELVLLPERGLFWARESMVLLADWHVGKAAAFRAAGIGVPDGDLGDEFLRVDAMLERTGASELLILGDFVHARQGLTPGVVGQVGRWLAAKRQAGVRVGMVSGNHDRAAGVGRVLGNWQIEQGLAVLPRPPFVLQHEPGECGDGYVLAGHIHPALRLVEGKRGGLRAPCFWFGARCGVLPAFGGFTGGHSVTRASGDRVFVVGGGEVVEVPG